jgi:hypothetical protein
MYSMPSITSSSHVECERSVNKPMKLRPKRMASVYFHDQHWGESITSPTYWQRKKYADCNASSHSQSGLLVVLAGKQTRILQSSVGADQGELRPTLQEQEVSDVLQSSRVAMNEIYAQRVRRSRAVPTHARSRLARSSCLSAGRQDQNHS